ncbi:MAG: NAD(P)-binding domain-containing protein [Candidatus Schekmanbacteria bacterium]|nr:NAD(P)-binding domain-containing protein [Candidatus Schekmanbacteria bacterium]
MKIAVIGTGNVGKALGLAWAGAGHEVVFGSREPHADGDAGGNLGGQPVRSQRDAAAAAEVVVLATPWAATRSILAGIGELSGKIVVDCTNPLLPGFNGLDSGGGKSGAERVATWATGAHVVKAFNTTGASNMAKARALAGPALWMPICGDDQSAKDKVAALARELGFEPMDVGPLANAGLLESLAMLWITIAYKQGVGPGFSFSVVRT